MCCLLLAQLSSIIFIPISTVHPIAIFMTTNANDRITLFRGHIDMMFFVLYHHGEDLMFRYLLKASNYLGQYMEVKPQWQVDHIDSMIVATDTESVIQTFKNSQ